MAVSSGASALGDANNRGNRRLAAAFEAHHVLHDGLACFRNFGGFAGSVGAIFAELLGLAVDFDRDELVDLIVAPFARGHDPSLSWEAMGIFDRMGKVISSNLNGMIDKAEDDKKLLELNLEEMADQLKAGRQDVIAAVAAEKQLRKKYDDLKAEVEKWEKRAELALKSEDEALAREAIRQKKRCEGEVETVEKARLEQRDTALKMKEELERMEQKLDPSSSFAKDTIAPARAAQACSVRPSSAHAAAASRAPSTTSGRWKRRSKAASRRARNAGKVEDALGTRPKKKDLEDKFRDLERGLSGKDGGTKKDTEIEDELAALKKRIRV